MLVYLPDRVAVVLNPFLSGQSSKYSTLYYTVAVHAHHAAHPLTSPGASRNLQGCAMRTTMMCRFNAAILCAVALQPTTAKPTRATVSHQGAEHIEAFGMMAAEFADHWNDPR
jgi:hypothetical protein